MTASADAENLSLLEDLASTADKISAAVQRSTAGPKLSGSSSTLPAEGHVLIEDVRALCGIPFHATCVANASSSTGRIVQPRR